MEQNNVCDFQGLSQRKHSSTREGRERRHEKRRSVEHRCGKAGGKEQPPCCLCVVLCDTKNKKS